jgi:hypothetical protein
MTDRTSRDGQPYYCLTCGLGYSEFLACEDGGCELEPPDRAARRATLAREVPQAVTTLPDARTALQDQQCRTEAQRRVRQVLALISDALGQVDQAQLILGGLQAAAPEHEATGETRKAIRELWYKVEQLRDHPSVTLDPDSRTAFLTLAAQAAAAPAAGGST